MDPRALWSIGVPMIDSAFASFTYFSMGLECASQAFIDNYVCLIKASVDKMTELRTCAQQYERIIAQHPSQDMRCKALQTYDECQQRTIADVCGAVAGEAICELTDKLVHRFDRETATCKYHCSTHHSSITHRLLSEQNVIDNDEDEDDDDDDDDYTIENSCDAQKFNQCSQAFKTELGIRSKCVYGLLMAIRQIMEKEGKAGYLKICRAGANFNKCGGTSAAECLAIETLEKQLNISEKAAIALNMTAFSLNYECSHPVFENFFECYASTQKSKRHVLKRCGVRYEDEIKKHPGVPCKAAQQLMDCVSSPFKRACGQEAANGLCLLYKSIMETYAAHVKGCPLHCDV
jgi:hypothetical protein